MTANAGANPHPKRTLQRLSSLRGVKILDDYSRSFGDDVQKPVVMEHSHQNTSSAGPLLTVQALALPRISSHLPRARSVHVSSSYEDEQRYLNPRQV